MSGSTMNYVMGGLQTLGGAGATALGAPQIGVPMMASGVGDLSGQAAGGSQGAAMGSGIGSLLGGAGMGGMGMLGGSGFAAPGTSGTPSLSSISGSLPSWLNPNDIIGESTSTAAGPSAGAGGLSSLSGGSNPLSGLGSIGQQYMNYVLQSRLNKQSYAPPRAPAFSSNPGAMTGQLGIPGAAFPQLPQIG